MYKEAKLLLFMCIEGGGGVQDNITTKSQHNYDEFTLIVHRGCA